VTEKQWHFERAGQKVGPFPIQDLRQLAAAGLIQPETTLIDSEGNQLIAANSVIFLTTGTASSSPLLATETVDSAPSLLPHPPPPPPPPFDARTSWPGTANPASSFPASPWNPYVIGWLSLLFSPVWGGVMAALNGSRLRTGAPSWRPILIGVGSFIVYLVVINLLFDLYWVNLALYVNAVILIWEIDLKHQVTAYEQRPDKIPTGANWILPGLGGFPATLLVILVFVIVPLIPPSAREVCDQFMRGTSLSETKKLTTSNLWPALTALDRVEQDSSPGGYELTEDGPAPAQNGGHLVAYRTYTRSAKKGDTVEGVFHLVDRNGGWKIEEVYFTGFNRQAVEEWIPLSRNFDKIVATGKSGRSVASSQPATGIEKGNKSTFSKTVEYATKTPGMWMGLKALFATAGAKKFGAILVALVAGLSALTQTGKQTVKPDPNSTSERASVE
jgi:hypothetical protein